MDSSSLPSWSLSVEEVDDIRSNEAYEAYEAFLEDHKRRKRLEDNTSSRDGGEQEKEGGEGMLGRQGAARGHKGDNSTQLKK